jgi:hypothetical protein
MVQLLWNAVQDSSKKLQLKLPYDPEIPLLGVYLKEMKVRFPMGIHTSKFMCVKFTIPEIWKPCEHSPTNKW